MRIILLLLFCSCTEIFIPNNESYQSVHLNSSGWINIDNQNYSCDNGLRVFDNDFTFEVYFSGDNNQDNTAGTLFSLVGKQTENFIDSNCNGLLDENETDSNDDGILDDMLDDEFITLAIHNDPSVNNVLSFYVNDIFM